ncbi:MAG: calcium/sodium antiporter [Candidatus Pacebacteria bacterium]|nr:calcium/sodium antiporter [Candidatus Paceibacterota bacterium]
MYLLFWIVIFIVSLIILIKSADFFTESSEKIGLSMKISPFIVGVAIVSIGTSLPELATSVIAVFEGQTEIVTANAVGSNIANILLVIGIASIVARKMSIKRSLINLDLPLLATATTILFFVLMDKKVSSIEGSVLLSTYLIYFFYIVSSSKERSILNHKDHELRKDKRKNKEVFTFPPTKASRNRFLKKLWTYKPRVELGVFVTLIGSAFFIYIGARYTVESIINIADNLGIETAVIAMSAVAIGTSLPELVVSVRAAMKKKYEIALGNVFGSNIFNALMVVGVPAIITDLDIDDTTFYIGMPFLIAATILYIFSGISRKIYNWEGLMYLVLYFLFLIKIFGIV